MESMNILVLGGTRFFGIPMVKELTARHNVTIATRGLTADSFGGSVERIKLDRTDAADIRRALSGRHFDLIIDKIAYCSNDIRNLLQAADCGRYILMSSTAVYNPLHENTTEDDFLPEKEELIWCNRPDFPYAQVKRYAEAALFREYSNIPSAAVRYPFVIGRDDYTGRLRFYVKNAINGTPMRIDNPDAAMSFISSEEAGKFLAFIAEKDFCGAINGASGGTVSIRQILDYVEKKTGKRAVISEKGEPSPYNSTPEYSINTDKAAALGYNFRHINDYIYDLLDYYIAESEQEVIEQK